MTLAATHAPLTSAPWWRLAALTAAVLLVHALLLLGMAGSFELSLHQPLRTGPLQTRWLPPPATAPEAAPTPAQRQPRPRPRLQSAASSSPALSETPAQDASASRHASTGEAEAPPSEAERPQTAQAQSSAPEPVAQMPLQQPATPAASTSSAPDPAQDIRAPLSARPGQLPPSTLLHYRLAGMDRGLNYHASGELRWQRNDSAYALSLSVRAFLIGSRQWRSTGQITASGLEPVRFSDSWRSERAAHFDRTQNRIVFSTNTPVAPLLPGAQDQISIYLQLAGAMAGEDLQRSPGTRLRVQTAGVRNADEAVLSFEQTETLQLDGRAVETAKWVLSSGGRYDARVEFWVAQALDWLPARIRITQASGSYIDLSLQGREALPDLPTTPAPAEGAAQKTTPS